MSAERRTIVGVMGSGSDDHRPQSEMLGRQLARLGVHLLTGGGQGVMAAVSEAFASVPDRRGQILGVLPCCTDEIGQAKAGYPNPWVEIAIRTHLPQSGSRGTDQASRNHINVLTADAVVVLPGNAGTASEVDLALRYGRPVIGLATAAGTHPQANRIPTVRRVAAVIDFLRTALAATPSPTA